MTFELIPLPCTSLMLEQQGGTIMPVFIGYLGLNPGDGACYASALPTEIHPQPTIMPLWRREPATEQDAAGFVVPDEEKEWVVSTKSWFYSNAPGIPDHGGGRRCFCAFLVDLNKALVGNLGHGHILLSCHSRKVRLCFFKGICHSQTLKKRFQVITLLQL